MMGSFLRSEESFERRSERGRFSAETVQSSERKLVTSYLYCRRSTGILAAATQKNGLRRLPKVQWRGERRRVHWRAELRLR